MPPQQPPTPQPSAGLLTLSSATVSLGNAAVGTQSEAVLIVQNVGPSAVTLSEVMISGSGFAADTSALPAAIPVGGLIALTFQFTPQFSGVAGGRAALLSDAVNSPTEVQLTGSGITAPAHFVALNWAATSGLTIAYNVYRGTTSGGPYALQNTSPLPRTAFTDFAVAGNTSYFYVVTSVAENGIESTFSPEVSASVPGP